MGYQPRHLSVLAYANGFTLWHYRSSEPMAAILAGDYFLAAHDLVRTGDIILITGGDRSLQAVIQALGHRVTLAPMAESPAAAAIGAAA